ncbi:kinase-like protein, partial [Byssothecium circinans]
PWQWDYPPRKIDFEKVLPRFNAATMTLADPYISNTYVKHANMIAYGDSMFSESQRPISVLNREIATCEYLRQHPHPHVCGYLGMQVNPQGYVFGLVFERFQFNLSQVVAQNFLFDGDTICDQIENGINHMHSLGLVHCDIKPDNIFVDVKNMRAVVGDFDSTHKRGETLSLRVGTYGWTSDRFFKAHRENDFHGLGMIRWWLE